MRLESALYSAREGLDAHGKAISVIGDNISNSNTIGFRASRTEFADLLSGGVAGGANGTENAAIPTTGSGVAVQRVRQLQQGGVIEFTGRSLDVAIDGKGFLLLGAPDAPFYSKAGNLEVDQDGFLANSQGFYVLGLPAGSAELSPLNMAKIELSGEATTGSALMGNVNSTSAVTTVPQNPQTYKELGAAASFTFQMEVYDSLGTRQDVGLYFIKTAPNTWTVQAYVDGSQTGGTENVPQLVGQTDLKFQEDGTMSEADGANAMLNMQTTFTGAAQSNIGFDLSRLEQFASDPSMHIMDSNGQAAGAVDSYEIQKNGEVIAVLDSGSRVLIGTLQLGTVENVDALDRGGHGLFMETGNTGSRLIGAPQSMGFGATNGSSLELSAVDISTEFVNLTLYQRGYQANSQILNATNGMLRDTLSLIR